ncbi:MAG: class I SAM-dependent methyltransferase, partial [Vicinamibacteria bacterium]
MSPDPPRRALDLCCGTGALIDVLKPLARELVVGLDISHGMLRVAERSGAPRVRADALAPPFASAFDLVTCFSALGHILPSDQRVFARAVARCLRPNGRFVFVTGEMPSFWSRGYWLSRGFNAV